MIGLALVSLFISAGSTAFWYFLVDQGIISGGVFIPIACAYYIIEFFVILCLFAGLQNENPLLIAPYILSSVCYPTLTKPEYSRL